MKKKPLPPGKKKKSVLSPLKLRKPGKLAMPGRKKRKPMQKILVVEDDEANILVAQLFLEELGYAYDIARNSNIALEKAAKKHYNLILMDIRMAGRDGIETTRLMRAMEADGRMKETPIIAVTADGDKERCIEAGMDDYVTKPMTLKTLKDKIISNIA